MTILLFLVGFILGAGAIVFALQNNEIVSLTFMGWQFDSSLALLVIVAVAVGMLISMLAFLPSAVSGTFRIMGLKKENRKLADVVAAHESSTMTVVSTDSLS
jgi:uncharacterized integral membrane protein